MPQPILVRLAPEEHDADVARRGAPRRQLEQSSPRGEGVLDRMGPDAANTAAAAPERTQESLAGLLTTRLEARQRAAVEAVCTDMHRPYLNAVPQVLPKATVVLDTFHVLQHAGAALDEVRRHEFFRADPVMRRLGQGSC